MKFIHAFENHKIVSNPKILQNIQNMYVLMSKQAKCNIRVKMSISHN